MDKLTPEEAEKFWALVGFVLLILGIIVAIIIAARIIFWFSVVLFFLSILYFVIGGIIDILRVRDGEDYFDGFPNTLLAVGLILLFWVSAHMVFPVGYSPTSEAILKFAGQIDEIRGLPLEIQRQALNDVCKTMQNNPSCDMIKNFLTLQEASQGVSDLADTLKWVFKLKVSLP